MKTLKLMLLSLALFLIAGNFNVKAQTFRNVFTFPISDWQLSCDPSGSMISISGEVTYMFTFTVNPKTGLIMRIHNNVLHADIYDTNTQEKYVYLDTGNDNLGTWWQEWLGVQPDQPAEGTTVASTGIKIIGKGGIIFNMKYMIQFHLDSNENVIVDFRKDWLECNF